MKKVGKIILISFFIISLIIPLILIGFGGYR